MGRNKIKIEKKGDSQQQSAIFNKRRNGIAKKTKELAILCDIDALLLSISPKGKIDLILGPNSNLEDVIRRYAKAGPEERHNGRSETIEVIKEGFKGDPDHEVDVQQLMKHGVSGNSQAIEGQQSNEISPSFLDSLVNIDNLQLIYNFHDLAKMEAALVNLIYMNRRKKMSIHEERARAFQQNFHNLMKAPQCSMPITQVQQSNLLLENSELVHTQLKEDVTTMPVPMQPESDLNNPPCSASFWAELDAFMDEDPPDDVDVVEQSNLLLENSELVHTQLQEDVTTMPVPMQPESDLNNPPCSASFWAELDAFMDEDPPGDVDVEQMLQEQESNYLLLQGLELVHTRPQEDATTMPVPPEMESLDLPESDSMEEGLLGLINSPTSFDPPL